MQISLPDKALLPKTVPPLNVFRMVAHTQSVGPFIDLARSILAGGKLDPKLRELAVLRVAHVAGSAYAFGQHVALAKMLGVPEADIAATTADPIVLDDTKWLVCRVADEITLDVRISDDTLAELVARFGEEQAVELILCCSYFNMVARFLESTRVPLDLIGGAS